MTATSTRRAILAGVAALPALSLPTVASDQISSPDLAERFAALYQRWLARSTEDLAHTKAYRAAIEKLTGMTYADYDAKFTLEMSQDERVGLLEIGQRASLSVATSNDDEEAQDEWDDILDELNPLVRDILSRPINSLADLRLHIQAYAVGEHQFWTAGPMAELCHQPSEVMNGIAKISWL